MSTLSTTSTISASSEDHEHPQATSSPNNGLSVDSNNPPCLQTGRCYCPEDWNPTTHAPPQPAATNLTNMSAMALPRSVEADFQSHRVARDERTPSSPAHLPSGLPSSDQCIPLTTPLPPVDDVSSINITPQTPGQGRDSSSRRQVTEPGIPPFNPPGELYLDIDINDGFFPVNVGPPSDPIRESLRAVGLECLEIGPVCTVRPLK